MSRQRLDTRLTGRFGKACPFIMKWLLVISVLAATSSIRLAYSMAVDSSGEEVLNVTSSIPSSALDIVTSFRSCFADIGFVDCAKNVLVRVLNNAINSNAVVRVTRYLVIRKNPDFVLLEADERTPADWHTLISKVRDFLDSRSIQLSLVAPDGRSLIPFGAEARGKKHKHKHQGGMYMMGGVAFMAMMAQLVLGKVALLAAVALIMAKIALVFSTLNGFKKAAAASGGGEHVVYESGHGSGSVGGSGWQRSIEPKRQTGGGTSGGGGQWDDDDNVPYRRRRPDYDYSLDGAR